MSNPGDKSASKQEDRKPPAGTEHAKNERQRQRLQDAYDQLTVLVRTTDPEEARQLGIQFLQESFATRPTLGALSPEYAHHIFNYDIQYLRRVASAVQKHLKVEKSDIESRFIVWSPTNQSKPEDDASTKDKWRWMFQFHLDFMAKVRSLEPAAQVILFCLNERVRVDLSKMRVGIREKKYELDSIADNDENWKMEKLQYACHALYDIAWRISAEYGGREVTLGGNASVCAWRDDD